MGNEGRICKHHWSTTGEQLHWGRLDVAKGRRSFYDEDTPIQFAPSTPVVASTMEVELHLDFEEECAWGWTEHTCQVLAPQIEEVCFWARALSIENAWLNDDKIPWEYDGEMLRIALPKPLKRGASPRIRMAHRVTRAAAGIYFTNPSPAQPKRFRSCWTQGQDEDSRYYLPCLDAPNFKQCSKTSIYVPKGMFALSNGRMVEHIPNATASEDCWRYELDQPYSTYLFSIVAGNFSVHEEKPHDVTVRWCVQRGREAEGQHAFGRTADILQFFSQFTHTPYPFECYTQIAAPDFIFGGMENFTVTTQTDLTLHDTRAHLDFASEDLVAHEAAHTWFGNMVTARSWSHAWLHESFATYFEALYLQHWKGEDEYHYQLLQDAQSYFAEDKLYRRPLVCNRYTQPIDLFDAHLYPGGAVRLRNLHMLLGDNFFRKSLQHYLATHSHGLAETVDLSRATAHVSAQNYDWWFHQWIFCAGYPKLEASFAWAEKEKQATVTLKQFEKKRDPTGSRNEGGWFRLQLKVLFDTGKTNKPVFHTLHCEIKDERTTMAIALPNRPRMVLIDPDYTMPCKQVDWKDKSQDLLLHELSHAPNVTHRIDAAMALAKQPSLRSVQALKRALAKEAFWGVRVSIVRAIGEIGGEAARDTLLVALKQKHPKVRREVVRVLGWFKQDPKVGHALSRKAKRGDASYYVEAETAKALGAVREKRAKNTLTRMMQRPSHVEVICRGALEGLAALDEENVLPLLLNALQETRLPLVQSTAMRASATLARGRPHLMRQVREALLDVLERRGDPPGHFFPKLSAIRALATLNDEEAIPSLLRMAEREADGRIKRLAQLTAQSLRDGMQKPQALYSLQSSLDKIQQTNQGLRERLDKLEQGGTAKTRAKTKAL